MNSFSYITSNEIKEIVSNFKDSHQILFSNYFGLKDGENYEYLKADRSMIIRRKEHDFYRLFILSSDEAELMSMLDQLKDCTYVINIPTKKELGRWENIMEGSGFEFLAQYDRYYNKQIEYRESEIGTYAEEKDANAIMRLLYVDDFSIYTDYLPTEEELILMIRNRQVIVNKTDFGVLGVLIFTIEGKKCYLNIWIDRTKNGLFLLFDAYNIMQEKGITLSYFWVKSTNKKIIKLHKLTGAIADGLSDYSYIKRA
jgi:hypothetical protein